MCEASTPLVKLRGRLLGGRGELRWWRREESTAFLTSFYFVLSRDAARYLAYVTAPVEAQRHSARRLMYRKVEAGRGRGGEEQTRAVKTGTVSITRIQ